MKKTFRLEELDCAACAAKMETAIRKIPGVDSACVSFVAQKLSIEAEDGLFPEILEKAVKIIARVEPDYRVII